MYDATVSLLEGAGAVLPGHRRGAGAARQRALRHRAVRHLRLRRPPRSRSAPPTTPLFGALARALGRAGAAGRPAVRDQRPAAPAPGRAEARPGGGACAPRRPSTGWASWTWPGCRAGRSAPSRRRWQRADRGPADGGRRRRAARAGQPLKLAAGRTRRAARPPRAGRARGDVRASSPDEPALASGRASRAGPGRMTCCRSWTCSACSSSRCPGRRSRSARASTCSGAGAGHRRRAGGGPARDVLLGDLPAAGAGRRPLPGGGDRRRAAGVRLQPAGRAARRRGAAVRRGRAGLFVATGTGKALAAGLGTVGAVTLAASPASAAGCCATCWPARCRPCCDARCTPCRAGRRVPARRRARARRCRDRPRRCSPPRWSSRRGWSATGGAGTRRWRRAGAPRPVLTRRLRPAAGPGPGPVAGPLLVQAGVAGDQPDEQPHMPGSRRSTVCTAAGCRVNARSACRPAAISGPSARRTASS